MDLLKKEICFLSKDKLYSQNKGEKYTKEIILSPHYYWYFEKKLPVSNLKRAKAIAMQMLETSLPTDKKYEFILSQKEKNIFDIYVIDLDMVISKLNQLGIEKRFIASFGFSHKEFEPSQIILDSSVLYISEQEACEISKNQDIQSDLFHTTIDKALEGKEKLEFKYSFGKGNLLESLVENIDKNFIPIAAIFILLIGAFIINIFSSSKLQSIYDTKREELLSNQQYATHSVQLKYVMDEMLDLDAKQKKFILGLKDLTSISSNNNTFIEFIRYDKGEWSIKIVASDKNQATNLVSNKGFEFLRQEGTSFIFERIK